MNLTSRCRTERFTTAIIGRITTNSESAEHDRFRQVLLCDHAPDATAADGFAAVMVAGSGTPNGMSLPTAYGFAGLDYLSEGDVVVIEPRGFIRTLYRRSSPHNFILMTEQCNSFCLMCSQPPKLVNDRDRIFEHMKLIDLIDPETPEIGITGGEPTLFREDFLRIITACRDRLPRTTLHVLTNGRAFFYRDFARRLAAIRHPDLMLGIPLYSSIDSQHDYVVQARGAYEETVIGLQHLAELEVPIEIRVVLHQQTYKHLTMLAEFIVRNLPFVQHVALMGLEPFGFARPNINLLWIDPVEYGPQLVDAVETLALSGLKVSIYNHQLCTVPQSLWPFTARSISDWKNVYLSECNGCEVKGRCGGFFQSAGFRKSASIKPVRADRVL